MKRLLHYFKSAPAPKPPPPSAAELHHSILNRIQLSIQINAIFNDIYLGHFEVPPFLDNQRIILNVHSSSGQKLSLPVHPDETIPRLQLMITYAEGILPHQQKVLFKRQDITEMPTTEDGRQTTLRDCGVETNSMMYLTVRPAVASTDRIAADNRLVKAVLKLRETMKGSDGGCRDLQVELEYIFYGKDAGPS